MTLPSPTFDAYDDGFASRMREADPAGLGGIPGYLAIRNEEVGPGRLVAVMDVRPELLNPFGNLHGGTVAALVDHVLGSVLYPVIERGAWAATTEFKLNFLAPVREGKLVADARIVSMTRRTAVVQIDVLNDDRPAAVAQGTVLIQAPKRKDQ